MSTLTAAGIALCVALSGAPVAPATDCDLVFMQSMPPCDAWGRCPATLQSAPDDAKTDSGSAICTPLATYKIDAGGAGTTRLCTRPATVIWLPDGRWAWQFEDTK